MPPDTDFSIKEVLQEFRRENHEAHEDIRKALNNIALNADTIDDRAEKAHARLNTHWRMGALIAAALSGWVGWLTYMVIEHLKAKA